MNSSSSYYGSRISLISNKEIRYEGTLAGVDSVQQQVRLENVQSFGTEGRERMEPNGVFVPPSPDVYEYVVFRGSDIKELQMTQQKPAFVDPAIQDAVLKAPQGRPAPQPVPQYPQPSHGASMEFPSSSTPVHVPNAYTGPSLPTQGAPVIPSPNPASSSVVPPSQPAQSNQQGQQQRNERQNRGQQNNQGQQAQSNSTDKDASSRAATSDRWRAQGNNNSATGTNAPSVQGSNNNASSGNANSNATSNSASGNASSLNEQNSTQAGKRNNRNRNKNADNAGNTSATATDNATNNNNASTGNQNQNNRNNSSSNQSNNSTQVRSQQNQPQQPALSNKAHPPPNTAGGSYFDLAQQSSDNNAQQGQNRGGQGNRNNNANKNQNQNQNQQHQQSGNQYNQQRSGNNKQSGQQNRNNQQQPGNNAKPAQPAQPPSYLAAMLGGPQALPQNNQQQSNANRQNNSNNQTQGNQNRQQQQQQNNNQQQNNASAQQNKQQTQGNQNQRQGQGQRNQQQQPAGPNNQGLPQNKQSQPAPSQLFDFSNAIVDKKQLFGQIESETSDTAEPAAKGFSETSKFDSVDNFFDRLSCQSLPPPEPLKKAKDLDQNDLNFQTFGAMAHQQQYTGPRRNQGMELVEGNRGGNRPAHNNQRNHIPHGNQNVPPLNNYANHSRPSNHQLQQAGQHANATNKGAALAPTHVHGQDQQRQQQNKMRNQPKHNPQQQNNVQRNQQRRQLQQPRSEYRVVDKK